MPERFEDELRELDAAGMKWERDAGAESSGVLRLHIRVDVENETIPLVATFPDNYPFFPFIVEAPSLDLEHHQHPFGHALCLIPRSTKWWLPGTDRLALLLRERLATVLHAGRTTDIAAVASTEEHVPEPFSDYYRYQADTIVLIAAGESGRDRVPASAKCGVIVLGIADAVPGAPMSECLRAALLEVRDDAGAILLRAPAALAARYQLKIEGRWARRDAPVRAPSFDAAAEAVYRSSSAADSRPADPVASSTQRGFRMQVRAVLFPEERRWRGEPDATGDGWAFAVRLQSSALGGAAARSKHVKQQLRGAPAGIAAPRPTFYLARPGRYAPGDLMARAPELARLRDHEVAVFGLGCVGSPSVIEFARASVGGLRLLDHDVVDPASTMRWQFGLQAAGRLKAQVLHAIIASNYPYVRVLSVVHRIGQPRAVADDGRVNAMPEAEVMSHMLDSASLIYDATAEWGVQRFLADTARERGIPYLGVESTPGAWGGMVVRIVPGETEGCWLCLQHRRGQSIDSGGIPAPPHDAASGDVHPEGCADPTYTGANVDLNEVARMGVRTALGLMTGGEVGAYPAVTWDVAVLELREPDGTLCVPRWKPYQLKRHPDCAECARRE